MGIAFPDSRLCSSNIIFNWKEIECEGMSSSKSTIRSMSDKPDYFFMLKKGSNLSFVWKDSKAVLK